MADDRPNILFILTDDQRYDALGCAGNDIILLGSELGDREGVEQVAECPTAV